MAEWSFTEYPPETLTAEGWIQTTATKNITRGDKKGKWRLWWNNAQGGVWARDA
jgi:hypothetical protein